MSVPGGFTVLHGDCLAVMPTLPAESVDAIVTDPPYGLGFMGKAWDDLPPGLPWATECLRLLKPGGHLLAFGGTRTSHRMAVAIEDAGFEIRDSIAWLYGSGFPKSLDVSKAIDKAARGVPQGGADPTSLYHGKYRTTTTEGKRWDGDTGQGYGAGGSRFLVDTVSARTIAGDTATTSAPTAAVADDPQQNTRDATATDDARTWNGWGTALKPAHEPIIMARKPFRGTVAANVLTHGTGAINVDACRIEFADSESTESINNGASKFGGVFGNGGSITSQPSAGRWPANVALDEDQAAALDEQSGTFSGRVGMRQHGSGTNQVYGTYNRTDMSTGHVGEPDSGGASRFFYVAKANAKERPKVNDVAHPTVKPLALMRWLCRLVTPPGGHILDPFAGSGATLEAALLEGFRVTGIEREADYLPLIQVRLDRAG